MNCKYMKLYEELNKVFLEAISNFSPFSEQKKDRTCFIIQKLASIKGV